MGAGECPDQGIPRDSLDGNKRAHLRVLLRMSPSARALRSFLGLSGCSPAFSRRICPPPTSEMGGKQRATPQNKVCR
eukprot:2698225-Alexandrium_andersonii.AAC.1